MIKTYSTTQFEITNEYVSVINDDKYQLYFDEINSIIIRNDIILFIPNSINKIFIASRIEFKNDIIKALKKYKKDYLIID